MSPPRVYRYQAGETGLLANAYLVEGGDAVVAVDAPLLLPDGHAFRARLDALRKPLAAVLFTHSHPDHYNTVSQLVAGLDDVPIIALAEVDQVIRDWDERKRAQWMPVFGEDWAPSCKYPTQTVEAGETVEYAGVRFTALDLGRGECACQSIWLVNDGRDGAFVGDMAFNGVHSYLGEGATGLWIDQLDRASELLAAVPVLYVGHGDPAGPGILRTQQQYLLTVRTAVAHLADADGRLDSDAKAAVVQLMQRYLPNAPLSWLVDYGADEVAAELAATGI